jgi:ABC-type nitrate/sulfonate/bicarbonate transport system permease component
MIKNAGIYALSIIAFLLLWHFMSAYYFNPILIPPPLKVGEKIVEMASDGELLFHTLASLNRIVVGYFWGCLLGITIGVGIGLSKLMNDFVDPPIQFVRSITPVAIVPLAILAFGLGEASKYVVIIYGSFIPIVLNTAAGLASVPKIRIRAAQCLGAPMREVVRYVMLPSAWPFILTGLRLAMGFSFMGVVAAEMIAADTGVGFLIMQSRNMLLPEQMFTGLFMLGVLGLVTDRVFQSVIKRVMRRYMVLIIAESGFKGK